MAVAEIGFEQAAAQHADDVADGDLSGGARQRVAALFAARGLHEAAFAQHAQELGGIGGGNAFGGADFRDGETLSGEARIGQAHQAAHAVFFVGAELHLLCSLAMGMMSSRPSASRAASDMRSLVHGGSNVSRSEEHTSE